MLRPVSGEGERADADYLSAIMGFCGYIGEKMLHGILTTLEYSFTSLQHDYAMIMRRTPHHPLRHGRNTSPMAHTDDSAIWVQKGATLSDKTAQKEFGLRPEDILEAIKAGKLQYRHNTLYGNPCLKLLREEVECLVNEKYGMDYLQQRNAKTELGKVTTAIRSLQRKLAQLEKRKAELVAMLDA